MEDRDRAVRGGRSSFTLIEAVIAVAILAILFTVVVLVLRPGQMVKQGRDGRRRSDLVSLNGAVSLYASDVATLSLGATSTVFISIPDPLATSTAGTQCQGVTGLPVLAGGYIYHCPASSTATKVDGTGWLPVDLTKVVGGSPIERLPVDSVNTTSTGTYYEYAVANNKWSISALMESQKYQQNDARKDGGYDSERYEIGTDLTVLRDAEGLMGQWLLNEGGGAVARDSSGFGADMQVLSLVNQTTRRGEPAIQMDSTVSTGCVNQNAGVYMPTVPARLQSLPTSTFTAVWWNKTVTSGGTRIHIPSVNVTACGTCSIWVNYNFVWIVNVAQQTDTFNYTAPPDGGWNHFVFTFDKPNLQTKMYVNGVLAGQGSLRAGGDYGTLQWLSFGAYHPTCSDGIPGESISDVRLYNKVMSASEAKMLYEATQ